MANEFCGYPFPMDFLKMLASTLLVDATGKVLGFNFIMNAAVDNCVAVPYVDCDNNHLSAETLLSEAFGVDACGNLAIKLVNGDGSYI